MWCHETSIGNGTQEDDRSTLQHISVVTYHTKNLRHNDERSRNTHRTVTRHVHADAREDTFAAAKIFCSCVCWNVRRRACEWCNYVKASSARMLQRPRTTRKTLLQCRESSSVCDSMCVCVFADCFVNSAFVECACMLASMLVCQSTSACAVCADACLS